MFLRHPKLNLVCFTFVLTGSPVARFANVAPKLLSPCFARVSDAFASKSLHAEKRTPGPPLSSSRLSAWTKWQCLAQAADPCEDISNYSSISIGPIRRALRVFLSKDQALDPSPRS